MLNKEQQKTLDHLWNALNDTQRAWVVGYVNGRAQSLGNTADVPAANALTVHLFYATETGNTKAVATQLEKQLKASGFKTRNTPLSKAKLADIATLKEPVLLLSSTQGEGDPPEMAHKFFNALKEDKTTRFDGLRYAVLGLGDRAYKQFCAAAIALDADFAARGAQTLLPARLLDVDYASHVPVWVEDVVKNLAALAPQGTTRVAATVKPFETEPTKGFSRLEPITGTVQDIINLNDRGSAKETYHIELGLDEALPYHAGDAAGIILTAGVDGTVPTPRLYSIASSPLRHPQEVHLTVALASHALPDGTRGFGLCSHYLAQRKVGDRIPLYIQRNLRFRPPEDDSADIIMVGPGTGIAPFRAFLQERSERGVSGRSWLFYGDQHAHCDFLYQAEWLEALGNGTLTRLDVAFSRDQKQKVYVQHKLEQHAKDIYAWLENGARFYLCGAKSPMSEDVEKTLLAIIARESGKSKDAALDYLETLAENDRYVKDVY